MCDILKSDVWLLLIVAAAIAAILVCSQSERSLGKLAAFFTLLGDALALLSLGCEDDPSVSNSKSA